MQVIDLFVDPLYQSSTWGSLLMCLCVSLLGVVIHLRKQSLVGEVLSHASYPGVGLGVLILFLLSSDNSFSYLFVLIGAFISAAIGYKMIGALTKKQLYMDTALCFTLASFLGIGVLLVSAMQHTNPLAASKIEMFLYGQVATMTHAHLVIYSIFSSILLFMILMIYYRWKVLLFDKNFSLSVGMNVKLQEIILSILIVIAVIIGIRATGVILISGMFIAPSLAARQFTNKLSMMFFLSAIFGLLSGILGNYYSIIISKNFSNFGQNITIPTGPSIILVACFIAILSILLAPKEGQLIRLLRRMKFHYRCLYENLLKSFWKHPNYSLSLKEIYSWQANYFLIKFTLYHLRKKQLICYSSYSSLKLTEKGEEQANRIVRLHRLWEVYLFKYLGYCEKKVHKSAEEMEHILSSELEKELSLLLNHPQKDPHNQPIPKHGGN